MFRNGKTSFFFNVILCLALSETANCLFEDQVGKFDWRQQYIGKVKFAYIDPTIAGSQKFIVATDENVIACLSTRTGSIIWRQILENGDDGAINAMSENGDLISISGGGQFIRSWDPNTGVLQWETSFPQTPKNDPLLHFYVSSSTKEIIRVEAHPEQHTKVSVYSFTRASLKTSEVIVSPWLDRGSDCAFVSAGFFVCVEKDKKGLRLLSLKDGGAFVPVALKSLGVDVPTDAHSVEVVPLPYLEASDQPTFALKVDANMILMQVNPKATKLVKILPRVDQITSTPVEEKLVVFSLARSVAGFEIQALDLKEGKSVDYLGGTFSVTEERGEIESFRILPYVKKDHGVSYKMLVTFEDHSVLVVHQQGRLVWSREEALSKIVSAEILDLPLSDTDANIEQEFGQTDAGVLSIFLTRVKSQVYLLQTSLLQVLLGDREDVRDDKKPLTRDTFGLHKIVVVLSRPGKAFGIDNLSGLIAWSHFERHLSPFGPTEKPQFLMFVQRTTSHFPFPPVCTAMGRDALTGRGRVYSFDPITGVTLDSRVLPYDILQAMPAGSLHHYLRDVLILDTDLKVHVYPESQDLSQHQRAHFMFTADPATGGMAGYVLASDPSDGKRLRAVEAWRTQLPQPIAVVATKRPQEHVHSQGRVMGDRSVLYKYLNPNLAAVFTEGNDDAAHKTFCSVYLVDIVTGAVVYAATHKRCRGPLHAVHAENWLVYSYRNDKSRRVEISSVELFEGRSQSNTTAFSSLAPPPPPLVEHQTFIFPSSVVALADTVTERGMTHKHLLVALPSGAVLELPKTFLDPRRPVTPLPEHREEGLLPYVPELPVVSEGVVNYNQSVMRVRGVVTAPSGLESTCLVFVHGLDLFYTRVTPSKTFDILKDDFDHYLISVVLLGLLALSYTTKRLAARKTLRAAWK